MSSEKSSEEGLVFVLRGEAGSYYHSNDGPDPFVGKHLKEEIQATSQTEAMEKARIRAVLFLQEHASIAPPSAPNGWESTYTFTLTQIIWNMHFVPIRKGKPAIMALKEVPAHAEEIIYI